MNAASEVWVYLSTTPLLHLTLTLAAFTLGQAVHERFGMTPLLNPVLIAVVLVVCFLLATGTSYQRYFEGAQFVHFLLGPATVCLALPLYRQFDKVRRSALALGASILTGSLS
ncbi:MAG: LrgB family protein, partial [Rhodocyclaceae bacterium]|nr:LrgB family protein [Rhodocyclaceae bacterium]